MHADMSQRMRGAIAMASSMKVTPTYVPQSVWVPQSLGQPLDGSVKVTAEVTGHIREIRTEPTSLIEPPIRWNAGVVVGDSHCHIHKHTAAVYHRPLFYTLYGRLVPFVQKSQTAALDKL